MFGYWQNIGFVQQNELTDKELKSGIALNCKYWLYNILPYNCLFLPRKNEICIRKTLDILITAPTRTVGQTKISSIVNGIARLCGLCS